MNLPALALAVIAIVGSMGGLALYFKKGGDKVASALDQNTIRAYKDSELVKDKLIAAQQAQLLAKDAIIKTKDDIIERLINDGKKS